jgi:hypothetical protein
MSDRSPLSFPIAQLRHAYSQLAAGGVVDQRQLAEGLLAPVIRELEGLSLSTPNSEGE